MVVSVETIDESDNLDPVEHPHKTEMVRIVVRRLCVSTILGDASDEGRTVELFEKGTELPKRRPGPKPPRNVEPSGCQST